MRSSRPNCSLVTEFQLTQENILIQNERITQLYVIQSEQNSFLWFGVLFVDSGIYMGAVMRFNMYIEDSYPDCSCPKIVFDPIPYHPLVNPLTGELDTKNAFPDWNSHSSKLFELLLFVKRVIRQADEYIVQIRDLLLQQQLAALELDSDRVRQSNNQDTITSANNEANQTMPKGNTDDPFNRNHHDLQRSQENVISKSSHDGGTNPTINYETATDGQQNRFSHLKESHFSQSIKKMFTWFQHTLIFMQTYENDSETFKQRIEEFREKCYEQLLDRPALCGDDRNALVFTPWDSDIHEPMRSCVLAGRFTPSSLFATYHKDTESVSFIPGHEPGLE